MNEQRSLNIDAAIRFRNMALDALTLFGILSDMECKLSEGELRTILYRHYLEFRNRVVTMEANPSTEDNLVGHKEVLFALAVCLFTFGDLNMVETILDNKPSHSNFRRIAGCLGVITPIPNHIYVINDSDKKATREWFKLNRDNLLWDEDTRRFVYKT